MLHDQFQSLGRRPVTKHVQVGDDVAQYIYRLRQLINRDGAEAAPEDCREFPLHPCDPRDLPVGGPVHALPERYGV